MILRYTYIVSMTICLFACNNQPKQPIAVAQGQSVPNMQEDFTERYPKAQEIVWDTLETGFAALFSDDEFDYKAVFDSQGKYQYTATFIEQTSLPQAIQQVLNKKYKDANAAVVMRIQSEKLLTYQIELETSTDYINLEFDELGKLLKEEKHPLSNEEIQRQEEEGVDENEK